MKILNYFRRMFELKLSEEVKRHIEDTIDFRLKNRVDTLVYREMAGVEKRLRERVGETISNAANTTILKSILGQK